MKPRGCGEHVSELGLVWTSSSVCVVPVAALGGGTSARTPPAAPVHTPSSSLPVTPIPTPLPGRPPRSQPAQGERTLRALELRSFSVGGAPPQLLAAQAYDLGPMAMAFDFDVRWPSEMVAGCPPRSSLGGTSAAPRMPLGCSAPRHFLDTS